MAVCQFTVFSSGSETAKGPPLNEGVITIGVSSTQSATTIHPGQGNGSRCVRIAVNGPCAVAWGANPTAFNDGTGGRLMGADTSTVEYFDIEADDKIAVIGRS